MSKKKDADGKEKGKKNKLNKQLEAGNEIIKELQ